MRGRELGKERVSARERERERERGRERGRGRDRERGRGREKLKYFKGTATSKVPQGQHLSIHGTS